MRDKKLIQFYLTNECNSKCKTCNIWCNKEKEELDVRLVERTIIEFPDADYVFGGGEFTLYSDRERLIKICNGMGINYTILTNCINITRLEKLLAKYDIKNLTISCDGYKHDDIRGIVGNLTNIMCIIRDWKGTIPNLKLSYTLSAYNENSIDRDMQLFKELGFKKIYFCIAQNMDLLKAGDNTDIIPSYESIKYIYETYPYMLYDKDLKFIERYLDGNRKSCTSINNVHTIYSNGDVVYCQSFKSDTVLGNIKEQSFKQILEDKCFTCGCRYEEECDLVCQRRYD